MLSPLPDTVEVKVFTHNGTETSIRCLGALKSDQKPLMPHAQLLERANRCGVSIIHPSVRAGVKSKFARVKVADR